MQRASLGNESPAHTVRPLCPFPLFPCSRCVGRSNFHPSTRVIFEHPFRHKFFNKEFWPRYPAHTRVHTHSSTSVTFVVYISQYVLFHRLGRLVSFHLMQAGPVSTLASKLHEGRAHGIPLVPCRNVNKY